MSTVSIYLNFPGTTKAVLGGEFEEPVAHLGDGPTAKGLIETPLQERFRGGCHGPLANKFGVQCMLNCRKKYA